MNGKDMLTTAAEGGINYWAQVVAHTPTKVTVIDRFDGTRYMVTAGGMTAAAKDVLLMFPNTAGAGYIRKGDIDAEAADMIFQTAALGTLVYG